MAGFHFRSDVPRPRSRPCRPVAAFGRIIHASRRPRNLRLSWRAGAHLLGQTEPNRFGGKALAGMEGGKPAILWGSLRPVAYCTGGTRERIFLPDELPACTGGSGRDVVRWSRPSALVQCRIGGDEPSPACKNRGCRWAEPKLPSAFAAA